VSDHGRHFFSFTSPPFRSFARLMLYSSLGGMAAAPRRNVARFDFFFSSIGDKQDSHRAHPPCLSPLTSPKFSLRQLFPGFYEVQVPNPPFALSPPFAQDVRRPSKLPFLRYQGKRGAPSGRVAAYILFPPPFAHSADDQNYTLQAYNPRRLLHSSPLSR